MITTTTPLSQMECRAVQLDPAIVDYALRMGDLVPAPEGGYGRPRTIGAKVETKCACPSGCPHCIM